MVVMSRPSKTRVDPRMRSRWATRPALGGGAHTGSERLLPRGHGSTLARRHMSASPRAQCIASHARQGTPSSFAMGFQRSGLRLRERSVDLVQKGADTASFCLGARGRISTRERDLTDRRLLRACCVVPRPSRLVSRGSSGSVICRRWGCGLEFPG